MPRLVLARIDVSDPSAQTIQLAFPFAWTEKPVSTWLRILLPDADPASTEKFVEVTETDARNIEAAIADA